MNWKTVALGDLRAPGDYSFVGGPFGSDLTSSDYIDRPGVPVIRGTNLDGKEFNFIDDGFVYVSEHKAASLIRNMAYPGDIIFTQRGTMGQVAQIPKTAKFSRYIVSQSQMKITVNESIASPRYVYHYYRSPIAQMYLSRNTLATGVPHINLGILRELEIPLPPLDEQRRIAEILDKADAIRRKRQEALALTDQLLRSTFLEMFGDPVANPKGWPIQPLETMVASIEPGWSASSEARPRRDGEWGVLKVSAVSTGRYQPDENKAVPRMESGKPIIMPKRGDLLFSRANTRDLVAAVCLVEEEMPNVFLPDKLWRITATDRACNEFLCELLHHSKIQSAIARVATGTSGSMLNVSQDKVRSMEVIAPPAELQAQFRKRYWLLAEHRVRANTAKHSAEALFASLTHRAFTGQL